MQAVILDHNIDTSFITQLEQRNEKYKFMRIDADVTESLKDETSAEDLKAETDALTEVFKKALNNDKLTVKVEKLKNENLSLIHISILAASICFILHRCSVLTLNCFHHGIRNIQLGKIFQLVI